MFVTLPTQTFTSGSGNSGSVSAQTAGTSFNITKLTATDQFTNIVTSYSGAKTISYSGPGGTPSYTTSVSFTSGQSTTTLATTLKKAETTQITATDGSLTGVASSSLTVNAGTFTQVQVLMPGESAAAGTSSGKTGTATAQTAGASFSGVVVNAVDANWNVVSSVTDNVQIYTSSDASAVLPSAAALVGGTKSFSVTFKTANGTGQTLTAKDTSTTKTENTSTATVVNKASPTFSGLTASQGITYGTASVTLSGTVSAPGSIVPANGETVSVTINGSTQNTTTTGGTGAFSLSFSTASIPFSGTAYAIQYAYAGDANLNAAPNDTSTALTVNKAALSITANNDSKTYGGTKTYGAGLTTFTSSGLKNSETIGSVTITASGGTTANAAVGSYNLTPSAATGGTFTAGNYTITYNNGTLTVNALAVSLTGSRTYDGTTTATAGILSVANAVGSDVVTVTSGSGTLASANVGSRSFSSLGTLALGGAATANYTLTGASGTVTITAATLTYAATIASRTYGASNPTFSGTVTGFVGTDTQANATTGTLSFTSSATSSSNVGSYAINGSGLTANNGNYTFVQAAGNATALTVTAATLTYTATAASRPYGASNPTFSGTVTGFVGTDTQANATTGTLSFTSSASSSSNVGSYAINGSGLTANNGNYTFVQAAGNATALTVTAATLTYTATAASRAYGASNPTFSGTVTGFVGADTQANATTGTLSFTSTATSSSNVGSYAINGSGLTANNGNYTFVQAAGNATALSVTAATLTYSANTTSRTYGSANPAFSGTVSGFVGSDTQGNATTGTLTFTSPATSSSNVGTYAINGSGLTANNGNYTFVQAAGNATALSVTAATLTYTATAASRTYGSANPTFSGTVTGFVGSDTQGNATTGTLSFTSPATSSSNAGSYAINGSGLTANNGNYTFVQAAGNATALTVTAATLTYTANAASRAYGAANPAFSGTVTGFVGSDTQGNATTGTLTFTSPATSSSNVGSYAINGSGLTANNGNYTFVQAAGNATALTVTAATLTYTANAASRTYGSANPTFSGTVSGFVGSDTQGNATTGTLTFTSPATSSSNVGTYAINGSGLTANNGNYTFVQAAGNATALTVTAATLSYTANAASRTYGAANPAFSGTVTGFVGSDTQGNATTGTLTFTSPATSSSNVGTYAINGSGLTANNGNYTFVQAAGNATALTVTAATLTYNANAASRAYGTANPAFSGTVTGFVGSDTQGNATTGTLTFTSPATSSSNVGTYAINGSGLTANNGNYTFVQAAGNATALTVTAATLTYKANAASRTYGAANPAFSGTVTGFVGSDTQGNATTGTLTFTSPATSSSNVGSYAINGSGLTANNGNYTFVQAAGNATALTVMAATLTYNANAASRAYGAANPVFSGTVTGFVGSDTQGNATTGTLTFTSAATSSSNVGTYAINGSGLTANNGNYTFVQAAGNATALTVSKATLTITSGVTADNKVYDTTDKATLSTNNVVFATLFNGDVVTLVTNGYTATFASADVGTAITVSVAGLSIGGADAGNYTLDQPTDLTANITASGLTVTGITASDKEYNGLTAGTLDVTGATLNGVIGSDDVHLGTSSAVGHFSDKTVGTGKTVTVSGLTLTGNDANKYTLTQPTTTASISAKGLTISGVTADNKVYDTTTSATLHFGSASLVTPIGGDDVTIDSSSASGSFADANVGNGKTVTASGVTLGGGDAGNYTVTQPTTTADITKATATVTIGNLSQTYDGSPKSVSVSTTPSGLTVDVTYNGSPTTPTGAGSYLVIATVNDSNYQGSDSKTLNIGKASASVTLGSLSQVYDGNPKSATATTTPSGLTVNFTYDGSPTAPSAVGTYAVVGTISDNNYQGSSSGTLEIVLGIGTATGSIELSGFAGSSAVVTFIATGGPTTNTWQQTLTGSSPFSFSLSSIPPGTTHLSAKVHFYLRRRVDVTFDNNNNAVVDFTSGNSAALMGGDLNDDNVVNALDYAIIRANWMKSTPEALAAADIDGDGSVGPSDYTLLQESWYAQGDPE
jgi:hypothetical protein